MSRSFGSSRSPRRAFTLIELLVVIAIIAILASILFPVFAQAREAARKTTCLSNFKQANLGILQYQQDYDEITVPVNSGGHYPEVIGWGYGRPDYVWPELVQPYVKNWQVFRCPSDPNATDAGMSLDPATGAPIGPSDQNYHYAWGERTDIGINYEFLCPWYYDNATQHIGSLPVSIARINSPASTILAIDTIWDRDSSSGAAKGGGNWVVESPCVYGANGEWLPPLPQDQWQSYGGWSPNPTGAAPFSWLEFGGAFPRHNKQINVSFCDGHAKCMTVGAVTQGCDVKANWGGQAVDGDKYLWDLR